MSKGKEWRAVFGYEGLYEVSSEGEIRRVGRGILAPSFNRKKAIPRLYVTLSKNNVQKTAMVHTVVCEAFYGPRPPGMEVAHWDGNSMNNNKDNLRWTTRTENEADKRRHGRVACGIKNGHYTKPWKTPRGETHSQARLTESDVRAIRILWASGYTSRDIGKSYGVSKTNILNIVNGKIWRSVP